MVQCGRSPDARAAKSGFDTRSDYMMAGAHADFDEPVIYLPNHLEAAGTLTARSQRFDKR